MHFRRLCTPLGGPASGLWPSKTGQQTQPLGVVGAVAPAPAPAPPTPPPPPTPCTTPTIFGDCFASCSGTINSGSPGPVCDWTFIEPFGPATGEIVFSPGVMAVNTQSPTDFPIASKPLPVVPASASGLSGRFDFTEYLSIPNPSTTYQLVINIGGLEVISVSLFGDGSLAVAVGDINNTPTYSGTFTPSFGAHHIVDFVISGAGVPTLYLDGVEVPLTPLGPIAGFWSLFPSDSVSYGGGAAEGSVESSEVTNIFVTEGATTPSTEFCCP